MMANAAIEICKAVVNYLNDDDRSFSQSFTAKRTYDLLAELQDDGIVHVDCAIREEGGEIVARGKADDEISVDIVVREKCNVDEIANLDALMDLLTEFKDAFLTTRLETATCGEAVCYEWDRVPAYFSRAFATISSIYWIVDIEI